MPSAIRVIDRLRDQNDVSAGVQAKGDLLVFNPTAGKYVKVPAGIDGQVLISDAVQAPGVRWSNLAESDVAGLTVDLVNIGLNLGSINNSINSLQISKADLTGAVFTGNVSSPRFSLANDSTVGVLTGINVKSAPYNAAGNGRVLTDGTMANGSAVLTSASAPFVPGDVGKRVVVNARSAPDGPVTLRLYTTIAAYTSATTVTLAAPAGVAYAGVAVIYGSDSTAAIQAAVNDAIATNRRVFIPGGTYLVGQIQITASIQVEGEHAGMRYLNQFSGGVLPFIGVSFVSMNGGNVLRLTGKPHFFGLRRIHFSGGQPLLFDQLDEDCQHTQLKDLIFENTVGWCVDIVPNIAGFGELYQFEWENFAVTNCANGLRLWLSPCSTINGIYFQGLPKGAFGIDCHSGDLTLNRFNGGGNSVAAYDGLPNSGACLRLHNTNCVVNGSKFENYAGSAIMLDNTASLKLHSCDFRDVSGQPIIDNQQIAVEFTSTNDRVLVVQSCTFETSSTWKNGTPIHQTAGSDVSVPLIMLIDTPNTLAYNGVPFLHLSTGADQVLSSITAFRDPLGPRGGYSYVPRLVSDRAYIGNCDSGILPSIALHWASGLALGRDGAGMNTYFDGGHVRFREGDGSAGGIVTFTGSTEFVGSMTLPNGSWLTSSDGVDRLYFSAAGTTYLNGQNSVAFRVNDGDVGSVNAVQWELLLPLVVDGDVAATTFTGSGVNLTGVALLTGATFTGNLSSTKRIEGGVQTLVISGGLVATDVTQGNLFNVSATGNFTLSNPTGANDGDGVVWRIKQDATGSRLITLGTKFRLSTNLTAVTLSTAANKVDYLAATYHAGDDKWDVVGFDPGH
jgi:hypothetical protein